jgi:hypothetical protein
VKTISPRLQPTEGLRGFEKAVWRTGESQTRSSFVKSPISDCFLHNCLSLLNRLHNPNSSDRTPHRHPILEVAVCYTHHSRSQCHLANSHSNTTTYKTVPASIHALHASLIAFYRHDSQLKKNWSYLFWTNNPTSASTAATTSSSPSPTSVVLPMLSRLLR